MTTMRPEDVAALFDLPPLPPAEPAAPGLDAAEAALAAELASTLEPGGVAADAPDSRADLRVKVAWPARLRLPDGRVLALEVRDVSERGVGLVTREPIPARAVVHLEMDVPPTAGGGAATIVAGTIRTTYAAAEGDAVRCGGTWVEVSSAGAALLSDWIAGR